MNDLLQYFQFPFVRNAFIVGILISVCASVLGCTLILKRYSFIGDGLSHVAFGAMTIAAVLRLNNNMIVVLPITVIAAVILLSASENRKIKGDAAIAMISVAALAFGYLLMNFFSTSSNISGDVCSSLFGTTSILTLSNTDVIACVVLSIVVLVTYVILYNKIFAVTFDESFANSTGMNVRLYNFLIAVIVAVIIVLAMNLVGSLLISALIIFPALSSMRVFKSFKKVVISSLVFAAVSSFIGILISVVVSTPVGSTIVAVDVLGFVVFMIIGKLR